MTIVCVESAAPLVVDVTVMPLRQVVMIMMKKKMRKKRNQMKKTEKSTMKMMLMIAWKRKKQRDHGHRVFSVLPTQPARRGIAFVYFLPISSFERFAFPAAGRALAIQRWSPSSLGSSLHM